MLVGAVTAHKAVAGKTRVGEVETQTTLHDSRTGAKTHLASVPAAVTQRQFTIRLVVSVECLQVDGGTEGRATACRSPHATLYLQALRHASEVGDVVPIDSLAFGVVEGDAVDVHIDAPGIDTTDAQSCGANSTVLTRRHHRRLSLEEKGHTYAGSSVMQLLLVHRAGGQRNLVADT